MLQKILRPQIEQIKKDLSKKMVLLVGPRQCGKTFIAKEIASSYQNAIYLNYDHYDHRKIIENQSWLDKTDLLVFDELHKKSDWKNYIKGVFDTKLDHQSILVTGSARLDIFDRIGDSLAGRYFKHRLLPFSLAETTLVEKVYTLDHFLERGGFPEPFLESTLVDSNRWRQHYITSLLSTDVFEYDTLHNLKALKLVFDVLRSRVGSPLSYQSIAQDAGISSVTVKKYIDILEGVYILFRITPYSKNIARSLLKEPKIYFYDNGLVDGDIGAKLENLVAVSLLKSIYAKEDQLGVNQKLYYARTKDGLEVDFVIADEKQMLSAIEVKTSDDQISKSLLKFCEKYKTPSTQVVMNLKKEYKSSGIEVVKANSYLKDLFL